MRAFTERIQAYMAKAAKEAKVHTSWINPSDSYDEALRAFVARVLSPAPGNRFPAAFTVFHEPIARLGIVNSLAQTVLKIAAPGVPDFYQGTELWDLSLVDPDNRRAGGLACAPCRTRWSDRTHPRRGPRRPRPGRRGELA